MPVFSIQFPQVTNYKLSPGFFAISSVAPPKHMQRDAHSAPHLNLGFQTPSQFMAFQCFDSGWTPLLFSLLNSKHLPAYSWNSEPASQAIPHYFWLNQPMRGVLKSYLERGKLPKQVEVRFSVGEHPKILGMSPEFIQPKQNWPLTWKARKWSQDASWIRSKNTLLGGSLGLVVLV